MVIMAYSVRLLGIYQSGNSRLINEPRWILIRPLQYNTFNDSNVGLNETWGDVVFDSRRFLLVYFRLCVNALAVRAGETPMSPLIDNITH
jgi:hypothetical protein